MKLMKRIVIIGLVFVLFKGCGNIGAVYETAQPYIEEYTPEIIENVKDLVENIDCNAIISALTGSSEESDNLFEETESACITLDDIPEYSGNFYVEINSNVPFFTEEELVTDSYEYYSELDGLSRPGMAMACIGADLMPTEERDSIGQVKPAGWHTVKYPDLIKDLYLYNRCHTIAYCLTGQNIVFDSEGNAKNLFTGTRQLNVEGMLPFEIMVAKYIENTGNHVMYRATPIYANDNDLLCSGILLEGFSVEDDGRGICFNVYCYNVQNGVAINYRNGDSEKEIAE